MMGDDSAAGVYLGIDVGGTNIKVGVVTDDGTSLAKLSTPTRATRGGDAGVDTIVQACHDALATAGLHLGDVAAVGLATPGTMDIPQGLLLEPPNLPGWENLPIRDRVGERLGRPTTLQNDANAAAYGEFWVGAGRSARSLVLWTLGTGIGCGIIIGDVIVEGTHSHGGECGHIIIEMDGGRRCDTGQYGTLEAYAGAKALIRRAREVLSSGSHSDSLLNDIPADEITPLEIAKAADAGDSLADELVMKTARYLGVGTTTIMHTIDPDMILFGGSMTFGRDESELGRRFLERIRQEVRARAFPVPAHGTQIDWAALGGDAGYIGAAGCARLRFRQTAAVSERM